MDVARRNCTRYPIIWAQNGNSVPENDYLQIKSIGKGGWGEVFLTQEVRTGREVVMNVLSRDQTNSLRGSWSSFCAFPRGNPH
jgi:serine/threonine protein kinase